MADNASASTPIVKRSVVIAGHSTSISLEEPFWHALKEIADAGRQSISELLTEIDRTRPSGGGLSSAARLHVLRWYQQRTDGSG